MSMTKMGMLQADRAESLSTSLVALKELADRSADLAVGLASQIIESKLTPDEHAKLVRQAVQELASTTPSKN